MKTAEQIKTIDGVEYELAVRDETTGYFGTWFCRTCWRGGVKYDLVRSPDEAMRDAERGATYHHKNEHGSQRRITERQ